MLFSTEVDEIIKATGSMVIIVEASKQSVSEKSLLFLVNIQDLENVDKYRSGPEICL